MAWCSLGRQVPRELFPVTRGWGPSTFPCRMQAQGASSSPSSLSRHSWPCNSQDRVCLFCFKNPSFSKITRHLSLILDEQLWVMLAGYFPSKLLLSPSPPLSSLPLLPPPPPRGKSRKTRFDLSRPSETPQNGWDRHNKW